MEGGAFYFEEDDLISDMMGYLTPSTGETETSQSAAPEAAAAPGTELEFLFEPGTGAPESAGTLGTDLDFLFEPDTFELLDPRSSRRRLNDAIQEAIDKKTGTVYVVDIGAILYDLTRGIRGTADADALMYSNYKELLCGTADTSRGDNNTNAVKEYPPLMYLIATGQLKYLNNESASQLITLTASEPFAVGRTEYQPFAAGNPWCLWMAERFVVDRRMVPWVFKSLDYKLLVTPSPEVPYGDSFLHHVQRQAFFTPYRLRIFMDAFVDHLAIRLPGLIFAERRFAVWTEWFTNVLIDRKGASFTDRSTEPADEDALARLVTHAIAWLSNLAKTATYFRIAYIEGIKTRGNDPRLTPSLASPPIADHPPLLFMVLKFANSNLFNLVHRAISYRERDRPDSRGDTISIRLAAIIAALARMPSSSKRIVKMYNNMILTINTDLGSRPQAFG